MNVTLWFIQVLLAVVLAATGTIKIIRPRLSLQSQMAWVVDASDAQVKGIGALEVLAAIGLVAPPILHITTFLTPLAAVGVIFLMIGAMATHVRIGERERIWVNVLLLVLAAVVAVGRFGPYPF
ncbi:MAG TPA: DoxX family protein [Candidatus Udaeobacter sp.]|nr:DoxX family protein [Candidatus Udaeobacter sp.]